MPPIVTEVSITDVPHAMRRALHLAEEMARAGRPWKKWLRDELERLVWNMCPFCGEWKSHEDGEHKFVAARTLILPALAPDRNADGTVRVSNPGVDWE